MALDVKTNNATMYGKKHKQECGKNAKDFYRRELLKQHVHKLCMELPINQMKPLQVFKMAIGDFENIVISKQFKSQMLCHIRNSKFQQSKVQCNNSEMSQPQSISIGATTNSKKKFTMHFIE